MSKKVESHDNVEYKRALDNAVDSKVKIVDEVKNLLLPTQWRLTSAVPFPTSETG